MARSHRFIAIVIFWLHFFFFFLKKSMERKLLCQLFTATNCSTLALCALKLICQTTFDSILFKSSLSHVGQLSCYDVTEVTWWQPRNVSLIVRDKVTRQRPQSTTFWRERRAEEVSNRSPSACQFNALPLGQTGSHNYNIPVDLYIGPWI